MASSSSRTAFPAVGDTFDSLDDFRRVCFTYGVKRGTRLSTSMSAADRHVVLCCPLAGPIRNMHSKQEGEKPCSHSVDCRRRSDVGSGTSFIVKHSVEQHTCSKEARLSIRSKAREAMQQKLEKLDSTDGAEAGSSSPRKQTKTRRAPSSDEDEEESEEESDEEAEMEHKSPARSGKGVAAFSHLYPSAFNLKQEITKLTSCGIPSFPSSTETFPSARSLLVTLHAAANTRGFTLYHKDKSEGNTTLVKCTKGHGRNPVDTRCNFQLKLEKQDDGRWVVGAGVYKHSHVVKDRDGREVQPAVKRTGVSAEKPSKKRSRIEATPSDTSADTSSRSAYVDVPSYTTQATSHYSYAPQQHSAAPAAQVRPIAPPPAIDYTFLPSLAHFVASITTAKSTLVAAAPSLIAHGFDSVEKLALLLSVSDEFLNRCVEDLGEVAKINKVQQVLVRKAVREARGKLGGGKSETASRAESREASLLSKDGAAEVKNEPVK